jgi:hypothetical protein
MVHGHDRNVRARLLFSFSNVSGGLQAVHLRHLKVHQSDVELPGLIALPKVHRLLSVVRAGHRVPVFLEKLLREHAIHRIILGQQDIHLEIASSLPVML